MDVGTAKPSAEQRRRVPHHLVDVLDPADELTVVHFRSLARRAIADVHARGATALLVGGSGLYWRAISDDLAFPPTDAAVRGALEERYAGDGPGGPRGARRGRPGRGRAHRVAQPATARPCP